MAGVRTDPLTQAEIGHYHSEGYLAPLQLISEQAAAGLRSAMTGHLDGQVNSERYELTDPVVVKRTDAADAEIVHRGVPELRVEQQVAVVLQSDPAPGPVRRREVGQGEP